MAEPIPFNGDRLDVPLEVRQLASGLSSQTARIAGLLGRAWSTEAGVKQSSAELLEVAENALKLRRLLCSR